MTETFSVSAIKNGTVIDHISAGQALRIINLLNLENSRHTITIGMNLLSKRIGSKDLIKIENRELTANEANEIVVFAPEATINVIVNFKVVKKISTHLPNFMRRVFCCPNKNCVTQAEPMESCFYIKENKKQILLTCHYCEKEFDRDEVKVTI